MDFKCMDSLLIQTPIGKMIALANENGVCSLDFVDENDAVAPTGRLSNKHLLQLETELKEYFEGKRHEFSVLLSPVGTPFQIGTWDVLRQIPYGKTVSYAQEAQILGRPKAVRAVANANGKNPISILIPCHRVIASGGGIGGYSGGVWRKEFLLGLEKGNHPRR